MVWGHGGKNTRVPKDRPNFAKSRPKDKKVTPKPWSLWERCVLNLENLVLGDPVFFPRDQRGTWKIPALCLPVGHLILEISDPLWGAWTLKIWQIEGFCRKKCGIYNAKHHRSIKGQRLREKQTQWRVHKQYSGIILSRSRGHCHRFAQSIIVSG